MAWLILVVAGLCEVGMVMGLNASEGFSKLVPSIVTFGFGGVSFYLLSVAMQSLPAGTAYAVWTGIGAAGAVALGIFVLNEPVNLLRVMGIILVLGGVVALRFSEGA